MYWIFWFHVLLYGGILTGGVLLLIALVIWIRDRRVRRRSERRLDRRGIRKTHLDRASYYRDVRTGDVWIYNPERGWTYSPEEGWKQ